MRSPRTAKNMGGGSIRATTARADEKRSSSSSIDFSPLAGGENEDIIPSWGSAKSANVNGPSTPDNVFASGCVLFMTLSEVKMERQSSLTR